MIRTLSFIPCFALTVSAIHEGSVYNGLSAFLVFLGMVVSHLWLRHDDRLASCHRALDSMLSGENGPVEDELQALLQRRDALEEKRGTPGFDPWEVQAVRREISDYERQHPGSTGHLD